MVVANFCLIVLAPKFDLLDAERPLKWQSGLSVQIVSHRSRGLSIGPPLKLVGMDRLVKMMRDQGRLVKKLITCRLIEST